MVPFDRRGRGRGPTGVGIGPGCPSGRSAAAALGLRGRGQMDGVHPAAVQQGQRAVREGGRPGVVGGQDDRDVVRAGGRGEGAQDVTVFGAVQRGGRLVGEEHCGAGDQGPGHDHPLTLGLEEGVRPFAGRVADVEALQPLQGRGLGGPAAGAAQHQRQGGVLPGVQLGDQDRLGVDPGEAVQTQPLPGERTHGVHGDAVEPDLPALHPQLAGQAPQERGLPAAARAGDGEDLALPDTQRHAVQGGRAVVRVGQTACPEHVVVRRGHHGRTPRFGSGLPGEPPVRGTKAGPIGYRGTLGSRGGTGRTAHGPGHPHLTRTGVSRAVRRARDVGGPCARRRRPAGAYSSVHASVSVARRICSISSKVDWSEISGGASWMTGSPRSSARQ